ncbi:hypothetical protein EV401DRAFT_1883333 [Pisolithus croceorrhizus]|nr:hypothetical protein EV401DRAFT_1883333 [Pisolithus croceorrhizus]
MLAVIVCEEGIELAHETGKAANYGEPPKIESKFFAKIALPEVNPVLLSLLTLWEEIVDKNERNMTMSFGTYFNFIAWAVTDPIVDAVVPFIEAYIKSPNRHQWEAAVMALWAYPGWSQSKCPDSHPEHVDNYFDVDAAASRNAVQVTVILQSFRLPDKPPNLHCLRRCISSGQVVSFRLSCNFYWYGLESSIDLHMPLLTSSKHLKDLRDTSRRRTRHRNEKLLKGGIGLPTGLGWTDSTLSSALWPSLPALPGHSCDVLSCDRERHQDISGSSHVMIQLPGYIYQIALMLV